MWSIAATLLLLALVAWLLRRAWLRSLSLDLLTDQGGPDGHAGSHRVFATPFLHEAQLVLDLLRARGIDATIRNEHLAGMVGEIPVGVATPEVWLTEARSMSDALEIVREYEARRTVELGPDVACPTCGADNPSNFEVCWQCRGALP